MTRWRLIKALLAVSAIAIVGLGVAAAVAASRDSGSDGRNDARPQDDDSASAASLGILGDTSEDPTGVRIVHVFGDSAAADAGLERDDVITSVDGDEVASIDDLRDSIKKHDPGDEVTLSVVKGGQGDASDVEVTLGEEPAPFDKFHRFRFNGLGGDILDGLRGIFPDGFDSFLDGSFRYKDDNGDVHEVAAVAGTITEASDDKITIDANDGDSQSFALADDTHVPDNLESGDDVIIISVDGDVEAVIAPGRIFDKHPFHDFVPDIEPPEPPYCDESGRPLYPGVFCDTFDLDIDLSDAPVCGEGGWFDYFRFDDEGPNDICSLPIFPIDPIKRFCDSGTLPGSAPPGMYDEERMREEYCHDAAD